MPVSCLVPRRLKCVMIDRCSRPLASFPNPRNLGFGMIYRSQWASFSFLTPRSLSVEMTELDHLGFVPGPRLWMQGL